MSKANVTLVEAQMGEGKTNTATGILADASFSKVYAVRHPSGLIIPATKFIARPEVGPIITMTSPLDPIWKSKCSPEFVEEKKIILPELYEEFISRIGSAVVQVTRDYTPLSTAKIFANFHLFGIQYVYCTVTTMLVLLNTGVIQDGILVIDEAYIEGEARRSMNPLTLIMTWFGQQMRKRNIELYLIVQHGRFIDWRFRYIMKRKIICSYNERTNIIRLLIQDLKKGTEKIVSYWAPQYWCYYDTNELPNIPSKMIEKAMMWG